MEKAFHVLVCGGGLAGLCAGIAALEAAPAARVGLVAPQAGPTGSSFCNRNGFLGVQAPDPAYGPEQEELFAARAVEIGAPGFVDVSLVRVVAEQARKRVAGLVRLGASVRPGRVAGCFLPEVDSGVVLDDLPGLHGLLARRFRELGGIVLAGRTVVELVVADGRAGGVVLAGSHGVERVAAASVVAAMGGPASLFAHTLAGVSDPGVSYALLDSAGARLANAGFVQFAWHDVDSGEFIPIQRAAREGWAVRGDRPSRTWDAPDAAMADLAGERSSHVPFALGRADAVVDGFYLDRLGPDATVRVRRPKRGECRIAPFAQAGNGGARIDTQGRTNVPGLFACGECATGMHGANRVGGAMAAAALVFGHRAGATAAREVVGDDTSLTPDCPTHAETVAGSTAVSSIQCDPRAGDADIPLLLSRHAACGGGDREALARVVADIDARLEKCPPHNGLRLRSARLVAASLLRAPQCHAPNADSGSGVE